MMIELALVSQQRSYSSDCHHDVRVGPGSKQEQGEEADDGIEGGGCHDETDQCNDHSEDDMPRFLVLASRRPSERYAKGTSAQIWASRYHQSDGCRVSQSLDNCWEEAIKSTSAEMEEL
jgi:hypothetical protein